VAVIKIGTYCQKSELSLIPNEHGVDVWSGYRYRLSLMDEQWRLDVLCGTGPVSLRVHNLD
jgi:hypothetical protein